MTLSDNLDHLARGIEILATHPGPIRERLVAACRISLCHVEAAVLPEPAAVMWDAIWWTVTSVPADDQETVLRRSIDALRDDEVVGVARGVLSAEGIVRLAIVTPGAGEAIHPVGD